jgi:hypothetical protein
VELWDNGSLGQWNFGTRLFIGFIKVCYRVFKVLEGVSLVFKGFQGVLKVF